MSPGLGSVRERGPTSLLTQERGHWDSVAKEWGRRRPHRLWGEYADAINASVLGAWLSPNPGGRLLKSDLFDEAWRGGLMRLLAGVADRVVGIDVSVVTAGGARRRCDSLDAVAADARLIPFRDCVFDTVVSNSTLDHFHQVDDIVISLRELHRVLRVGGELLLTLDNGANPVIALRNTLPFPLLHRVGLLPYFVGATTGPATLRRILETIGFEVRELGIFMHCPRLPAVWLAGLLDRRASQALRSRFLQVLMGFERLSMWPTRSLTGHFIAVRANKRG